MKEIKWLVNTLPFDIGRLARNALNPLTVTFDDRRNICTCYSPLGTESKNDRSIRESRRSQAQSRNIDGPEKSPPRRRTARNETRARREERPELLSHILLFGGVARFNQYTGNGQSHFSAPAYCMVELEANVRFEYKAAKVLEDTLSFIGQSKSVLTSILIIENACRLRCHRLCSLRIR